MKYIALAIALLACDAGPALQREQVERAPVPGQAEVFIASDAVDTFTPELVEAETSTPDSTEPDADAREPEADIAPDATSSADTRPDSDTAIRTLSRPRTRRRT